jgi:hypothetical protein
MAIGGLAIASMLMSTVPSLFQMGTGVSQRRTAAELAKTPRPKFEIPSSFEEALAIQREQAVPQQMAGLGYMEGMAEGGTARSLRGLQELAQSPAELLAAASNVYGNQQDQLGGIAAQNAQFMQENKMSQASNLINLLTQRADLQNKQFELNEFLPYMQAMNASAAMEGAGSQNIGRGVGNLTQGLASSFGNLNLLNSGTDIGGGDASVEDVMGKYMNKPKANTSGLGGSDMFEGLDIMSGASSLGTNGVNFPQQMNLELLLKLLGQ